MKLKGSFVVLLIWAMVMLMTLPPGVIAQSTSGSQNLPQAQLEQLLAPIALYPDDLLTQILMASTYPLEIVQADRWTKQNKSMQGDALTKALEAQTWDPSVKSLVNFPQVLAMMSEKIDWTQKLGNAFLDQQKEVMATVQSLRVKARAAGALKTTKEQVVKVEKEVIIIEPASPQVVYVPTYNPTVVYGAWAYPAYPPYSYYPPGYVASSAIVFAGAVAVGAAWGYAWGHANWHGGDVNINVNQNANINRNIDRGKYATQYQGQTGKYNQLSQNQKVQARQAYRGHTGSAVPPREQQARQQGAQVAQHSRQQGGGHEARTSRQAGGAFEGMDRSGSSIRDSSNRGQASRESISRAGSRSGGFGGGRGGRGGGRR